MRTDLLLVKVTFPMLTSFATCTRWFYCQLCFIALWYPSLCFLQCQIFLVNMSYFRRYGRCCLEEMVSTKSDHKSICFNQPCRASNVAVWTWDLVLGSTKIDLDCRDSYRLSCEYVRGMLMWDDKWPSELSFVLSNQPFSGFVFIMYRAFLWCKVKLVFNPVFRLVLQS